MFTLETKVHALAEIYGQYDRFVETPDIACEKYCSACCTCHVTLTTLEGYGIVEHLIRTEKADLLHRMMRLPDMTRFQPKTTTNMLAELCAGGKEIPEEKIHPAGESCMLLAECLCSVYPVRPFGCRCLVSRVKCQETGAADIDPFVVSVNTLFLQTIEHLDHDGYTGNLLDILAFLGDETHRRAYAGGAMTLSAETLVRNRPMTKLFVPPEHRFRIRPILRSLQDIRV